MWENRQRIYSNKIKCRHCGDVLESHSVHDYKECSCGAVAVDGGHDYLRRNYKTSPSDFVDLSVVAFEV